MRQMPFLLLLIVGLMLPHAPAIAAGKGMTMFVRNQQPHAVALEFRGRKSGTVWPGRDKAYLLAKGERKSVTLACQPGENVCYGAWAMGNDRISFGVGPDDDATCSDCCRVCVEGTTETIDIGG